MKRYARRHAETGNRSRANRELISQLKPPLAGHFTIDRAAIVREVCCMSEKIVVGQSHGHGPVTAGSGEKNRDAESFFFFTLRRSFSLA